jgi:hypothetical protein
MPGSSPGMTIPNCGVGPVLRYTVPASAFW